MNLGVSIANLLKRYPAVGVPGIGVFKKAHHPASYDADRSVFLPPIDRIELVEEDANMFPIVTYLEAQQQLDESAAEAMLEAAVATVMDAISRNGEALLDGLGYVFADGASLIFKPFEIDGFAAVPIAAHPPTISAVDEPVTPNDDAIDVSATEPVVTSGNTGRVGYTPWVIGGALAVVLIAAVAVWQIRPEWLGRGGVAGPITEADSTTGIPSSSNEPTPLADANRDSTVADTGLVVASADSALVDTVPAKSAPSVPSVTYAIIVGSFTSMRQAEKFVAEMKAKGYDLQALDSRMPGNRKKISWGSYATEEEAYKELARVQKTFEPGAWIAKIEHK